MQGTVRFALVAVVAIACAPARAPLSVAPRVRSTPEPVPACDPALPEVVGGFALGEESSFGRAGLNCMRAGHEWTSLDNGGRCAGTPRSVGFPATARLVNCDDHVCAVHLRYDFAFGGETSLEDTAQALREQLTERYGLGVFQEDHLRPCPRLEGRAVWSCAQDGIGIVDYRWQLPDRVGVCDEPEGGIAFRVEGDRGGHAGRISITYYTREAVAVFDLDNAAL